MKRLLIPLLLLISCNLLAAEVRTFYLQHRSAEEIIPILRPMLDANGGISGTGYTLIIRSSSENLQQLESIIQRLDQAPRMLLISVVQGNDATRADSGVSVSGSTADNSGNIRIHSTKRQDTDNIGQQLQVMEGHWATIRAGQAIPQVTSRYQQSPGGTNIEQHVEYRNVDSGFEVRPRISGEQVTLDIRPFRATPSRHGGGVIDQQEISTTVTGRIGQWIDLGGVTEQAQGQGSGTIYSTRQRDQLTRDVRIRVELLDN